MQNIHMNLLVVYGAQIATARPFLFTDSALTSSNESMFIMLYQI